jgi:catechol 2,3-dioxygenase-like lactoylglutathione lyase family enzyme
VTGIHHVALTVSDLDRSLAFYTETMGFRPGRWLRGPAGPTRIVFVEVPGGGRVELFHHAEGAQGAPPRTDNRTLGWNHLAFGVADIDAEVARLKGLGVAFRSEPGPRTGSGIRVAFFPDPDGNTLELFEE